MSWQLALVASSFLPPLIIVLLIATLGEKHGYLKIFYHFIALVFLFFANAKDSIIIDASSLNGSVGWINGTQATALKDTIAISHTTNMMLLWVVGFYFAVALLIETISYFRKKDGTGLS